MRKAKEQGAEYGHGSDEQHEIRHKNPIKELGFAAMEHALTLDTDLSDGAYRTYALLKFYWQHKSEAFPTVDTMAEKRGIRRETIGVHLKELVEKGLITRKARVGTSTMTYLEDLPQEYVDIALAELERRDARREENLTAGRSPLGKSNPRREENLTQSTTNKENNNNTPSEKWQAELQNAVFGIDGQTFREIHEAWREKPDERRHREGMRQMLAGHQLSARTYLKAYRNFNPDWTPPTRARIPGTRPVSPPPISHLKIRTD